jgi:outer membrane lipoprotein
MKRIALLALISILVLSCAHAISKEQRAVAVRDVPFKTVKASIDKYKGSMFIWGGFIAAIRDTEDGTYLEIVQNPTDKYGYVMDTDVSGGRFLAHSEEDLDPLIYERGRVITIAGELIGEKKVKIRKDKEYVYPVIEIRELHLLKEEPIFYYDYFWWNYWPNCRLWGCYPYGPYPPYY